MNIRKKTIAVKEKSLMLMKWCRKIKTKEYINKIKYKINQEPMNFYASTRKVNFLNKSF